MRLIFRVYCEVCYENRVDQDTNDMTPFEMKCVGPGYKNQYGDQSRRFKCDMCNNEILLILSPSINEAQKMGRIVDE